MGLMNYRLPFSMGMDSITRFEPGYSSKQLLPDCDKTVNIKLTDEVLEAGYETYSNGLKPHCYYSVHFRTRLLALLQSLISLVHLTETTLFFFLQNRSTQNWYYTNLFGFASHCTSTMTPCGPFTTVRLYIVRFMAYVFDTQSDELLRELLRLDMLNVIMDLFFEFPLNSFLHSTCERLVRFLVLCALFQLETKPSHQVSMSLTSADAVHKAFFGTPQPSLEQSTISESTLADQSETRSLNSPPTVFWMFLHRLLVAGNLLGRIPQIWMNSQNNLRLCGYRGHLRLIANLITAVVGPAAESDTQDSTSSLTECLGPITDERLDAVATNGATNECDWVPELCSYLRAGKY
ncbi:hypothetical protein AHF37_08088 [Paragonimus kellicotti]|nr:hypothetical protein AHF37_08088 [Paragonimus kellicotti]